MVATAGTVTDAGAVATLEVLLSTADIATDAGAVAPWRSSIDLRTELVQQQRQKALEQMQEHYTTAVLQRQQQPRPW